MQSHRHRPALLVVLCFAILCGCRAKKESKSESGLSRHVGVIALDDSQQIMVNALDAIERRVDDENKYLGRHYQRIAKQRYGQLNGATSTPERWATIYAYAQVELLAGNLEHAFQLYKEAQAIVRSQPQVVKPAVLNQFYFDMGIAFMRYGETQNCCLQNLPDSCVFPFRPHTVHQDPIGSTEAIKWFRVVLGRTTPDAKLHHAARWLLNVSHMTLGTYPTGVDAKYLIPDLDKAAESDFPEFRNVAQAAGVATFSLAGGVIADDFDNDGHIDLVVSSFDPREPLRVFWNRGNGKFSLDGNTNLSKIRGGLNLVQTDYNNDGLLDIFVMRGGWLGQAGKHPNSLLRNLGSRKFVDVSVHAGLETGESYPSQTAAWADFDLDGDLDLYVGNEATSRVKAPCQLFQNQGDGTFREVAQQFGVRNDLLAKAVVWGDYDSDGDPDLYVSNYGGMNRLYRNDLTAFTDVASELGVAQPKESFPAWFFDANNDGRLDLFVSAYAGGIAELSAALLKEPIANHAIPRLYMGTDKSGFLEQAAERGLGFPSHPMGANYADLDNDGYLDVYLGTGWPELHQLMPNLLYRGGPDGFVDVTSKARVGHLQKGHGVAIADFDQDGDLDMFEQMGGFAPVDGYYDVLYENPSTETKWIKLKLVGTKSNRAAIGARVEVQVVSNGEIRSIYRTVTSGGSFGANPLELHIGLGAADGIRGIKIRWPGAKSEQELPAPRLNTRTEITEP